MIVLADVVWPALVLNARLFAWLPIVAGLFAEAMVLLFAFNMPSQRALPAAIIMNALSTVLGLFLIPLAGLLWEIFPGLILYKAFHIGTFNLATWTATFLLAVLVNSAIELTVLEHFGIPWIRKNFVLLGLANVLSVGLAYTSFVYSPL